MEPEALSRPPARVSGRLARVVFANSNTIDKYIGDAIMVHFGTPRPRDDDPVRALTCAAAMIAEMNRWNVERARQGQDPIEISISLHFGEVVVGTLAMPGASSSPCFRAMQSMSPARLERLTRHVGTRLMVSDDVIRACSRVAMNQQLSSKGLRPDRTQAVRGRLRPITSVVPSRDRAGEIGSFAITKRHNIATATSVDFGVRLGHEMVLHRH